MAANTRKTKGRWILANAIRPKLESLEGRMGGKTMINHYARMLTRMAGYLPTANDKQWYIDNIAKASEWLWETK